MGMVIFRKIGQCHCIFGIVCYLFCTESVWFGGYKCAPAIGLNGSAVNTVCFGLLLGFFKLLALTRPIRVLALPPLPQGGHPANRSDGRANTLIGLCSHLGFNTGIKRF